MSILVSVGIVLSLVFEAIVVPVADRAVAAVRRRLVPASRQFSIATVLAGTLIITVVAMLHRRTDRPRQRDLPVRVREPTGPRHRQADPRDPGRHPERRPRLLRADAGSARTSSRRSSPTPRAFNLLAAGIGVGILTIPLVASDLRGRDAGRAAIASRGVVRPRRAPARRRRIRVVVPAAISGIVAAMILAISRAIGETMVVALAAGATGGSLFTLEPARPGPDPDRRDGLAGRRQRPGRPATRPRSRACSSSGFVLFLMTLGPQRHRRRIRPPHAAEVLGGRR